MMEMVGEFPGADYLATSRDSAAREWTVPDRLGEVGVPTVVAVGEREMDGFRAFADEAVAGIAGARAVVVPGAGHLLPLETPDVVADLVVEHLGREA